MNMSTTVNAEPLPVDAAADVLDNEVIKIVYVHGAAGQEYVDDRWGAPPQVTIGEIVSGSVQLIKSHWSDRQSPELRAMHLNVKPFVTVVMKDSVQSSPAVWRVVGLAVLSCPAVGSKDERLQCRLRRQQDHPSDAVEITFVVVDTALRGRGIGRQVMSAVEALARDHYGYAFVRLWTSDQQIFYERCGYHRGRLSQRVMERKCFQTTSFSQGGLNKLNALLAKRQQQQQLPSSTTTVTLAGAASNAASMTPFFKQLIEELPIPFVAVDCPFRGCSMSSDAGSETQSWFRGLPWQRQVGPSCGLMLLRMIREHLLLNKQFTDDERQQRKGADEISLLQLARDCGVSTNGEILAAEDLAMLAQKYLLPFLPLGVSMRTSVVSIRDVNNTLRLSTSSGMDDEHRNRFFLIPYDRSVTEGGETVGRSDGLRAHWGCVVGVKGRTTTNSTGDHAVDDEVVWLQHGMSAQLCQCKLKDLVTSNEQLQRVMLTTGAANEEGEDAEDTSRKPTEGEEAEEGGITCKSLSGLRGWAVEVLTFAAS